MDNVVERAGQGLCRGTEGEEGKEGEGTYCCLCPLHLGGLAWLWFRVLFVGCWVIGVLTCLDWRLEIGDCRLRIADWRMRG